MVTTARRIRAHTVLDHTLEGVRVAVAVRDPAVRRRLVCDLAAGGCRVRPFTDAVDVLLDVGGGRFDVVVGSLEPARLDAGTLLDALRDRFGPGLAVIVVGGDDEDERTVARVLLAGADDFLLAPTPEVLRAKLRVHLRRRASQPTRPSPSKDRADPEPPCRLDGHDLLRVLGRGAYGTVYEARRLADGREVALKLLAREVGEDRALLVRFMREVAALETVRSRHVVRSLGTGHAHGRYFLVMELVRGRPAGALAGPDGRAEVAAVVRMARDVCAAIEALQACGLVHRDIKPSNILVDERGRATLVDFGLAKRRGDPEVSARFEVLGTLPYLAPEVVDGAPQDAGSDLYALGATLWELLTGRRPFQGETQRDLLDAICAGRPVPEARVVRPDVPPSVSWLVARLMDPDPAHRLRDPHAARRALGVLARAWPAAG